MNGFQGERAGSPSSYHDASNLYANYNFEQNVQPAMQQKYHQAPLGESWSRSRFIEKRNPDKCKATHFCPDFNMRHSEQWSSASMSSYNPTDHRQHHLSSDSFSSDVSSFRSSCNSTFSSCQNRDSMVSSTSGWSQPSALSRSQYISQTEYALTQNAAPTTHSFPPSVRPYQTPKRRSAPRQTATDRDYFKTCVSVTRQPRQCAKEHKFFCTICMKTFVTKADWKRHEETYQERREMFKCDLCAAIYFLDKDFSNHHIQSHRCASCNENIEGSKKRHAELARQQRLSRTGWGCGFCLHFSSDWNERCNHIAEHIEKGKKKAKDWHHSCVIHSLLQRPEVFYEWRKLLESKDPRITNFGWNLHSTGRVEGYPETNPHMQLQDALEYFPHSHSPENLAQLAYEKAVKRAPQLDQSALPLPPPPPVPPKDDHASLNADLTREIENWARFADSILTDEFIPLDVPRLDHIESLWESDDSNLFMRF